MMVDNAWYYYFSSLAQTVASGSALLVALAVIRLQALTNSLESIERSLAELFYRIGKSDEYRIRTIKCFLKDEWTLYFTEVEALLQESRACFPANANYTESSEYMGDLIAHGKKFDAQNRGLNIALAAAFIGTIAFSGASILVLPLALWISKAALIISWLVSAILLVLLFSSYFFLVRKLRQRQ